MSQITNKDSQINTLIIGLGKTGLSCARYCQVNNIPYAVLDTREQPPALAELKKTDASVKTWLGGFDEVALQDVQRIILSPGVALHEPFIQSAIERGIEVIGDVELFVRTVTTPIIAISGSNGKSTVTTLLGEMAKCAGIKAKIAGNIGTPVVDLLLDGEGEEEPEFYILELSSFQLETTRSLNALAAVVLNVSPDHMDRYNSIADYVQAKQKIYHGDGALIINKDDVAVMSMMQAETAKQENRKVLYFGLDFQPQSQFKDQTFGVYEKDGQDWIMFGDTALLPVSELKIPGRHNQSNALAALALGTVMGLPMVAMLEALRNFAGLKHRTQWLGTINNIEWYNDSKGTNLGATISAIQGLAGAKVLIAGGEGKDADFSILPPVLQKNNVHHIVLMGVDAEMIAQAIDENESCNTIMLFADSMQDAVNKASSVANTNDKVLLSPACASFDMFKSFEHRGDEFIKSVSKIRQEHDS